MDLSEELCCLPLLVTEEECSLAGLAVGDPPPFRGVLIGVTVDTQAAPSNAAPPLPAVLEYGKMTAIAVILSNHT